MEPKKVTIRNYPADLCISAVQKGIRRGDFINAAYFAVEILMSGWYDWIWKRLLICSAEDVTDFITAEIKALHTSWKYLNAGRQKKMQGRVFLVKAVYVLCQANKGRDTDHLLNFVYKGDTEPNQTKIEAVIFNKNTVPIPDYAYDCHTEEGRRQGATKEEFFRTEQQALTPINSNVRSYLPNGQKNTTLARRTTPTECIRIRDKT